ncbi:hypothetical protein R1flu_024642 [Riccia fluitans]|uniref:Uncharacterized protein n=1 Tax=Riccia fluitans TaxID=41844 RepID=A0ABD1XVG7_9MARC
MKAKRLNPNGSVYKLRKYRSMKELLLVTARIDNDGVPETLQFDQEVTSARKASGSPHTSWNISTKPERTSSAPEPSRPIKPEPDRVLSPKSPVKEEESATISWDFAPLSGGESDEETEYLLRERKAPEAQTVQDIQTASKENGFQISSAKAETAGWGSAQQTVTAAAPGGGPANDAKVGPWSFPRPPQLIGRQ